jgi:hypothetical protein
MEHEYFILLMIIIIVICVAILTVYISHKCKANKSYIIHNNDKTMKKNNKNQKKITAIVTIL